MEPAGLNKLLTALQTGPRPFPRPKVVERLAGFNVRGPISDALSDVWPRKPAWFGVLPQLRQLAGAGFRADSGPAGWVAYGVWRLSWREPAGHEVLPQLRQRARGRCAI